VFSAFHEPLDTLARRLDEAGVPYDLLDGRTNCGLRGVLASKFQAGRPAASSHAGRCERHGRGQYWFRCSNAILIAFDWAYNIFEQAIKSHPPAQQPQDVTVYPIICKGTIDRRR